MNISNNKWQEVFLNIFVVLLFVFVNPIYALFFCAFLNLTIAKINYWIFSFMFALSFALMFFLKDYSLTYLPNNSDVVNYITRFQTINDLSWLEIFYRFISTPHSNEPLFWIYNRIAWTLFSGNASLYVFFHFFITFVLISYLAKIVDTNKFVIIILFVLLAGFGIFFSLAQAWRYTFAFVIFMIGVFSFGTKGKKWLPRIIIYSSVLFHLSTALLVIFFEVFIYFNKKSHKYEISKLYSKEIIGYVAIMVLAFVLIADYSFIFLAKVNLNKELLIYYQSSDVVSGYRSLFNWFSFLICMFLWLERKNLTNTDVFIATQYFIINVLLIAFPMPTIFTRYSYYSLIAGSILIGKLITTVNFRFGIILLTLLFCYDIYIFNYSTQLIEILSSRLYTGYLNPAHGLYVLIHNYDTFLKFNF